MKKRIIWLTGLPASGKTTLAGEIAERYRCELLDGDAIRATFSNTDFSRKGREKHLIGVCGIALMLVKYTNVVCSFITPYEDVREKILDILPPETIMIHVSTPLEICEARDPKGHYAEARAGVRTNFTGVSDEFEEPRCAHFVMNCTDVQEMESHVASLSHLFEQEKAVFLPGRWQPLHVGHEWLIQEELDAGKRVVVGVRDTPVSSTDPYPAGVRKRMIEHRYAGENVDVIIIPDIEAISYGRQVGYEVRETCEIPPEVFRVSATHVRSQNGTNVSPRVKDFMLSEGLWNDDE